MPPSMSILSSPLRWTANALLGGTGVVPQRTCVTEGGALYVVRDETTSVCPSSLQVVERDGLVMALASGVVTAEELLAAYDATAKMDGAEHDTRRRVNALRGALGDVHASKGPFAVAVFDAAHGRILAARTANAVALSYGFTADGTLVVCAGLSADSLFPEAGAQALELSPLPSGRFIFGHRYVKPIEFTKFWGTASANRSAAPARRACERINEEGEESVDASEAKEAAPAVGAIPGRWDATASAADNAASWKRSATPAFASLSAGKYVPPAMRKAAAARQAEEEEKTRAAAVTTAQVSPRSVARRSCQDAQLAVAIASEQHIVASLENALVSALELNLAKQPAAWKPTVNDNRPNRPTDPVRSLKSTTLDAASWERALAASRNARGASRRSMDVCARHSMDSRRGSFDVRGSMEIARAGV